MQKTCSVCGRIHDFNKICKRQNTKKKSEANSFRKSNSWKEKSVRIRQRDKYLCQVCITGKYDTAYRYTYNELEVHHIIPIAEDYSKRLDDNNLITLCRYHHEMAESGAISKKELQGIVAGK